MTQALAVQTKKDGGGIVRAGEINIAEAVQAITQAGLTPDAVGALEKMIALQERQQDREARQQFMEAFARVRAKCQTINATKQNPDRSGNTRWWMAPLTDLQDAVEPILREEGLELGFDTRREGPQSNIVIGICILTHVASGHVETRECGVNAANAQGGDLGAATTAKRGALIAALGLKIKHDDNARVLGDLLGPDQISELKRRFKAVRPNPADERKFLAYALACADADVPGDLAEGWKQIRQGMLGQLHGWLHQAELKLKAPKPAPQQAPITAPAPVQSAAPTPEPSPSEQARILADEQAEQFAEDAVASGAKAIEAAYRGIPVRELQETIAELKPPPAKDRTREMHKAVLKAAKFKMLTKGS